jgi:hypothetical protein
MAEVTATRFDQQVVLNTVERGRLVVRMIDRINVDDVFMHLVSREIFRLSTGTDTGSDVPVLYKEFLLKERLSGQG